MFNTNCSGCRRLLEVTGEEISCTNCSGKVEDQMVITAESLKNAGPVEDDPNVCIGCGS